MSRTATTQAITHDGKDVLLFGRSTSLLDQKKAFNTFRGSRAHAEYREVSYQESDGHALIIRLNSPAEQKKFDEMQAKNQALYEAARKNDGKLLEQAAATPAPAPEDSAAESDETEGQLPGNFAGGAGSDLLQKSRADLLKIAAEVKAELPATKTKVAIVEAILAAGYKP